MARYHLLRTLAFCAQALLLALLSGCFNSAPGSRIEVAKQGLYSAVFSDDHSQLVVGSINHGGSLWALASNERRFNWNHKQGEFSQIVASAFSAEGQYAITATPQTMVLWNAESGQGINYWTAPSEILDIALTSNGNHALLGLVDHSAALFDVKNGGVTQVFYHDGRVNSVDTTATNTTVISGSDDYTARLWDASSGSELQRWQHQEEVQLVRLSPDGSLAFSMAKYDKAAIWDTHTGTLKAQLPLAKSAIARGKLFTTATFSSDNRYLLTGTTNQLVQLWSVDTMKKIKQWKATKRDPLSPTAATVLATAFGNNDTFYAVTADGFIHTLR
jgi:WD40 repeat protein